MASSTLRKSLEKGKFMSKSGLLDKAWSKITTHGNKVPGLEFETYHEGIYTFVVFAAPSCPLDSGAPTRLSGPKEQNPFYFLYSDNASSFSLHTPAYQHFDSACKNNLTDLKAQLLKSEKQVIITGAALGGAVASLFTLWLLEEVDPKLKRPLCITFGSPFIGDDKLQQILENSLRNSCFLHVADAAQTPISQRFKPFGTFLICDGDQCICIDDPETVTELLAGANGDEVRWRDYGQVLGRLAQPLAVDSVPRIDDGVISRMAERAEKKKRRYDRLKKLNEMKIYMMYIERYKKKSREENIGYYDKFKIRPVFPYENQRKELNGYWKELVEEVEKMPQGEKALLKTRSLLSGHNYRRLVEPLDIAEYYRDGVKREYRTTGRSRHYVMLEKWFTAEEKKPDTLPGSDLTEEKQGDLTHLLMSDSCFWAEVEEALLLTKTQGVSKEVVLEKLKPFEEYVWEMIKNHEVSPEIFLEESSFMKWWREYKKIKGSPSPFTDFMNNWVYKSYGKPADEE